MKSLCFKGTTILSEHFIKLSLIIIILKTTKNCMRRLNNTTKLMDNLLSLMGPNNKINSIIFLFETEETETQMLNYLTRH